jgi:hypothetical protein
MRKLILAMALAALCVWALPGCMITDYAGTDCTKTQGLNRVNLGLEIYTYADTCDTTIPGDTFANGMTGIVYAYYDKVNDDDGNPLATNCPPFKGSCGGATGDCNNCTDEWKDCNKWWEKGVDKGYVDEEVGGMTAGPCYVNGIDIAEYKKANCPGIDKDGDGVKEHGGALILNDILGNHPDVYYAWYEGYTPGDLYCWDAVGGWWGYFTDDRPTYWTWNTVLYNNPNSANPFAWDCPGNVPPRTRDCTQRMTTLTCENNPSEMWWGRYCYSYWGYYWTPPTWYSYCYDTRFLRSNCDWAANILKTEETNLDWLPGWDPNDVEKIGPDNREWATDCKEGPACLCTEPADFPCAYDGTGAATCFYSFTAEIDDSIPDLGLPMDKLFEAIKNAAVTEDGKVVLEFTGFKLGETEVIFSEPYSMNVPPNMTVLRVPVNLKDPWLAKASQEILDAGVLSGQPTLYVNGIELTIPALTHLNPNWLEARAGSGKDIVRSR